MSRSPWFAIDAATLPIDHARELRLAWERFLDDGQVAAMRSPIADSWRRCSAAGVDPSGERRPPVIADEDEASARWQAHPLAAVAPLVRECMGSIADEGEHLIVVTDADGLVLWMDGSPAVRMDAADSVNFTEGVLWSETGAGTNAIGTALATEHPVQVFAAEHFREKVQQWTCAAAPIRDPDGGDLLGIVDLTGRIKTAHPHNLAVAVATARAVEAHLECGVRERDDRLRSRYAERIVGAGERRALVTPTGRVLTESPDGWLGSERLAVPVGGGPIDLSSGVPAFAEPVGRQDAFIVRELRSGRAAHARPLLKLTLLGQDRAAVELDGDPFKLSPRHTEVLALLTARPDGMTSEELAADLYGDQGQPNAVRVEVCRLRKLIGQWIDTEPYRLALNVESDAARVRALLERGAVREAAEHYRGPLLPRSEAPGIVRERDALEAWLRQAVMTSDEDDALWAWAESPSGANDVSAWKRLVARLDFRDPRRSLAAARLAALRA
jgi:hypothetical protein